MISSVAGEVTRSESVVDLSADMVEAAIASLRDCERTVLVDFDHTLMASNSTELFLASARPAFMVSLILGVVRGLMPRRFYAPPHGRMRDYIAVLTVAATMPWTLLTWRRKAPGLFARHSDHALAKALSLVPPERTIIVSFGIAPVIRALLRGSAWEHCTLVATPLKARLKRLYLRKADILRAAVPAVDLSQAIFLTDSEDDRDLLDVAGIPHLVPRQGEPVFADARLYLPYRYASIGKFERGAFMDQAYGVDLPLALIATQAMWSGSPVLVLATVCLFVSLHAVYEIGYFENDFRSALQEAKPTLKEERRQFEGFPLERHAWLWAVALGVLGCIGVSAWQGGPSVNSFLRIFGLWCCTLLATRGLFAFYNRRPERQRVLIYPLLQAAKSFGLLTVIPGFVLGGALLAAQGMLMWMNYVLYRMGGRNDQFQPEKTRLAGFLMLATACCLSDPDTLKRAGVLPTATLLAWSLWRVARLPIRAAARRMLRRG